MINPKTYTSPSGDWSLRVDPSNPKGSGGATYTLHFEDEVRWTREHDITFVMAIVTDGGDAAGVGHTRGRASSKGTFFIAKLSWEGEMSILEQEPRTLSRAMHSAPNPLPIDLLHVPAVRRFLVRIWDTDYKRLSEEWRAFDLREGKRVSSVRPRELQEEGKELRMVEAARVVDGTPLVLVQWSSRARGMSGARGTRYALLELDGKCMWLDDLPRDFDGLTWNETYSLEEGGTMIEAREPGRFSVRHIAEGLVVTHSVHRTEDGRWTVSELDRRPYEESEQDSPDPVGSIPDYQPEHLGSFTLRPEERPEPAVRAVSSFTFDGDGHLAFLPLFSAFPDAVLKVVDREGALVTEFALAEISAKEGSWFSLTWDGAGRYLLLHGLRERSDGTELWAITKETGEAELRHGFRGKWVKRAEGLGNGGFAALDGELCLFDDDGRPPRKRLSFGQERGKIEDWTILSDGRFAGLAEYPESVRFLEADGTPGDVVLLEDLWEERPRYLGDLYADEEGGVVVVDSSSSDPAILRLRADGSVRAAFTPRYADGREFTWGGCSKIDGEGRLWVSDGFALLRLDDNGVVDRVLGEAPAAHRLGYVEAIALGPNDQIYVVGNRTGAVHVFAADGQPLHRCDPDPEDFAGRGLFNDSSLTVDPAGEVLVTDGEADVMTRAPHRFVRFSPQGERLGVLSFGLDVVSETCHALPGDKGYLVVGYRKVFLVDRAGKLVRTIERRPDTSWLHDPSHAGVAPDGSFAIITGRPGITGIPSPPIVHWYDAEGEPVRSLALPAEVDGIAHVAYDGESMALNYYDGILLLNVSGGQCQRLTLPPSLANQDRYWQPLLPAGVRELWLFDGERTIHRFARKD